MTIKEMKSIVDQCDFPDYSFKVDVDGRGEIYLRASYMDRDTVTNKPEIQWTRKWLLSPEQLPSEIVQTAFKCIITSHEHRVREWFTFKKHPVYCPHFDVEGLIELCEQKRFALRAKE
jgi:hypothetical protein